MKTSVTHVEKFLLGGTAYSNKISYGWCAISIATLNALAGGKEYARKNAPTLKMASGAKALLPTAFRGGAEAPPFRISEAQTIYRRTASRLGRY
jgi:hypothetical protein